MKHIFALLFVGLSAIGADTPIAVVKGTNVIYAVIADTNRFVPPAGASNIVVSAAEVSVVGKGWRYVSGTFTDPQGNGLPADVVAKKSRETKAKDFITKYAERKKNWDTVKVPEQVDVLGRLCALIEEIITLHPELLEPKETSQ